MQTRRALILVGLSVICNKLDLVTYVGSWIKCPLYFGLSVICSCLVLVGFPRTVSKKFGFLSTQECLKASKTCLASAAIFF